MPESSDGFVHEIILEADYDEERMARAVTRSVRPEVGEIDGDRACASITLVDATVTVHVRASDLVALRAGVTTWSGFLDVAERTVSIGSQWESICND